MIDTTVIFSGIVVWPSRPDSPSSHRQTAFGFAPGSLAAFRKPCGFIQRSSCQRSASSGGAATGLPAGSVDVPAMLSVDGEYLVRVLLERRSALPARAVLPRRRIESGLAIELLLRGPGFPIHGARVVGQRLSARPIDIPSRFLLLAHCSGIARA